MGKESWIKWFSELNSNDVGVAGAKGVGLAEMYNNKYPVPPGFVITSDAFKYFIEKNELNGKIDNILRDVNVDDHEELESSSKKIRNLIENSKMPLDLKEEIVEAYDVLDISKEEYKGAAQGAMEILRNSHEPPFVAVRSSAVAENFSNSGFSGQFGSYLNVKGNDELIRSVRKVFCSVFSSGAIYYRKNKGLSKNSATGIVVQKMIDSQKSGVVYTINPLNNKKDKLVEAAWGLGSGIKSGNVEGDRYFIDESDKIIERNVSDKKVAHTRNSSGKTEEVKLNPEISRREVLTGHELKMLANYSGRLNDHYKIPLDIEFCIDKEGIYLVQARPMVSEISSRGFEMEGNSLLSGVGASSNVSSGVVKVVRNLEDLSKIQKGNVIVAKYSDPDLFVKIHGSSGIIIDEGSMSSQGMFVAREYGIPAVVGTKYATEKLKDGQVVTVDGFSGRVIEGKGIEKNVEIKKIIPTTGTVLKTVVDLPDFAQRAAESGIKEVGLVRMENIASISGRHPVWYIKNGKLEEYISFLSKEMKKIARSFEKIWIRTSDFKSDEFRNLEGSQNLNEINPLLGDHGIRFSLKNQELLEAEFRAIKEVADEYGDKAFGIMVPKIISVDELREVKKISERIGFPENIKIGISVETPAAVQIINSLCEEGIDFVNIGLNDLTQYTLAVDKNNEDVRDLFDEMNPAVMNSIRYVLRRCKKYGVESGIFLEAGVAGRNRKTELVRFLIEEGINSITLNADDAHDVSKIISESRPKEIQEERIEEKKVEVREMNERDVEEGAHDHETAVLDALDETSHNYNPWIDRENDVPKLNEAIPVSSEDFNLDNGREVEEIGIDKKEANNDENKLAIDEDIVKEENEEIINEKDNHELGNDVEDVEDGLREDEGEDEGEGLDGGVNNDENKPVMSNELSDVEDGLDNVLEGDEVVDVGGEIGDNGIELPGEEVEEEPLSEDVGGGVFDEQEERAFDYEAKKEVEDNQGNQEALAQLFNQGKEKKEGDEDEVLDIF